VFSAGSVELKERRQLVLPITSSSFLKSEPFRFSSTNETDQDFTNAQSERANV
jgi:hypothetical protein